MIGHAFSDPLLHLLKYPHLMSQLNVSICSPEPLMSVILINLSVPCFNCCCHCLSLIHQFTVDLSSVRDTNMVTRHFFENDCLVLFGCGLLVSQVALLQENPSRWYPSCTHSCIISENVIQSCSLSLSRPSSIVYQYVVLKKTSRIYFRA